jgi:hypothetical protein
MYMRVSSWSAYWLAAARPGVAQMACVVVSIAADVAHTVCSPWLE